MNNVQIVAVLLGIIAIILAMHKTGPIGPIGPTGAMGPAGVFNILGTYATSTEFLQAVADHLIPNGNPGEFYLIAEDGSLYTYNGAWVDIGDVRGPTGPTGPTGATGATGAAGGTFAPYYGSFSSTETQTNLSSVNTITHNVTEIANGILIDPIDSSKIRIQNAGIYKFNFSIQTKKSGGNLSSAQFWARTGSGTGSPNNVPRSASQITLQNNNAEIFVMCEYIYEFQANDYFQYCWNSSDSSVILLAIAASSPVPSIPSIITNVYRIG